jgi:hypothetical protein
MTAMGALQLPGLAAAPPETPEREMCAASAELILRNKRLVSVLYGMRRIQANVPLETC